jgi:polysaccharide biosynthesis protein PslJ
MIHDTSPPVNRLGYEHAESEVPAAQGRPAGLPSWPLALVFAGYPIWWALGIGDMALALVAIVMAHQLLRRRVRPIVPPGFGVWLLFLAWVAFSVVRLDSGGRLLGFGYRGLIYLAATVAFIYVYSDRRTFSLERVAGLLTGFWGVVVVGGYLGLIWPLFTLRTPLSYLLPEGLLANELVGEMAVRRLTEFNPDAWIVLFPRPSAPFLYTNGWGNAYSLLTPVVIAYAVQRSGRQRLMLIAAVVASLVPALLSLNRGMFIGLGVAGLYITIRSVASGHTRALLGVAVASLIAAIAFAVLPVQDRLSLRLDSSGTNEARSSIYQETVERSLESPILGHGAPRPSEGSSLPPAGTHGHFWMVMFSHGIPAAVLFLAWLVVAFVHTWAHRASWIGLTMHTAILVIMVQIFYYGFVTMGLVVLMTMIAAAWLSPAGVSSPRLAGSSPRA